MTYIDISSTIHTACYTHRSDISVLILGGGYQSVSCEHPGAVIGFEQRNTRSSNHYRRLHLEREMIALERKNVTKPLVERSIDSESELRFFPQID